MELALQNGTVGYPGHPVLEQVTVLLHTGACIGLVGPNGAGKSTLLRTLAGILPPLRGQVKLNGSPLQAMRRQTVGQHIACLSQERSVPFAYTVEETVLMGRTPYLSWQWQETAQDHLLAEACLDMLCMGQSSKQTIDQLSGGERQRVLLARTLLQGTDFLLLDEPTAELDFVGAEKVFSLCRELAATGRGLLIACHDLELAARYCTHLILVGQQQILAAGRPQEVITGPLLSKAYGSPVRPFWNGEDLILSVEETAEGKKQWKEKIQALGKALQNVKQGIREPGERHGQMA